MKILIHSSKSMRVRLNTAGSSPEHIETAIKLHAQLLSFKSRDIQKLMKVSEKMVEPIQKDIRAWTRGGSTAAVLAFSGDIYSGLQAETFSKEDMNFAQDHLRILSGLYGILKPLDAIHSYRLEMGYKLPQLNKDLASFWKPILADYLAREDWVLDLSAKEYTKSILGSFDKDKIYSPKFLSVDSKTGIERQVVVHTKIARGAFAHWAVKQKLQKSSQLPEFNELGYSYSQSESTPNTPVYIAQEFKGIGLSVRDNKN